MDGLAGRVWGYVVVMKGMKMGEGLELGVGVRIWE